MKYVYKIDDQKFETISELAELDFAIPFITEHRGLFIEDAVDLWNESKKFKSYFIKGIKFSKNQDGNLITEMNLYVRN